MSRLASPAVPWSVLIMSVFVVLAPLGASARDPLVDSLDVVIPNESTVSLETESSIFVSPVDPRVVLVSNNHWELREGGILGRDGVSAWISPDAGRTWSGTELVAAGGGDPACAISKAMGTYGRFLVGQMDGEPYAHAVYYKDSTSGSWTTSLIPSEHGEMPHLWVDNYSTDSLANRVYCGWTNGEVTVSFSKDDGVNWTATPIQVPAGKYRGIGLNTDSNGYVYAVWGKVVEEVGWSIWFSRSQNGGRNWSSASTIMTVSGRCDESACLNAGKSMKAAFRPGMTIDRSTDDIYVVWAEKNGQNAMDIFLIKSTDGGASFPASSKKRVNQDAENNRADQWDPAIGWDECTGSLVVSYLDARDDTTQANTYVSVSTDGASSWQDLRVSDSAWSADFGTNPGYEYIGVAADDGRAFAVWSDDRSSAYRPYVSPFLLWGVQQDSITVTSVDNGADDKIDVTVDWATNILATAGDQVVVRDPNEQQYTSSVCTNCSSNGGKHHGVTTSDVPWVAGGTWQCLVESNRTGCSSERQGDWKTLTLWRVVPDSVSVSIDALPGYIIDVTVNWATTLSATAGDQIVVKDPNNQQYTSSVCTNCTSNQGKNHVVTISNLPCITEGTWSYKVESKDAVGLKGRSDWKTFKVRNCIEE